MKTISILQPWASLVIQGHKKIETRSWDTKYRGELLIHASKRKIYLQDGMYDLFDHMQRIGFLDGYLDLPYGAIIGKVNLVDTFNTNNYRNKSGLHFTEFGNPDGISAREQVFGDYSRGRYGWLLSDPVMFEKPLPCKGQLGIWNFDLLEYRRSMFFDRKLDVDMLLSQMI